MNQPVVNYDHKTIQMRRGGTSEWRRYGAVCLPAEGEICIEFFQDASGTRNGNVGIKVGNGTDVFSALPYLITNQNEDDRISDEQIQNWDLTVEKLANLTAAEIAQDNSALGDDVQAALNDLHSRLLAIDPDGGSIEIDDIPGLGDKLDTKAEQADLEQEILDRIAGDKALQDQIDAIDPDGDSDVDWSDIENKPTEFPPEAHDQGWDTITGKPADYPPSTHGHAWDEITGKPADFPPSAHNHDGEYLKTETDPTVPDHVKTITTDDIDNWNAGGSGASSWDELTGKPTEFPPEAHDQGWDTITGKPATYPPEDHKHEQSEIDGLELRLEAIEGSITDGGGFVDAPDDGKLYGRQSEAWAEVVIPDAGASSWNDLTDKPTEFPPSAHNHDGVYQPVGDYIGEAPNDGEEYARKNQGWVKLQDHNYTGADAVKLTGDQSVAGHKTWTGIATFGDTVTMRGTLNGDDTANFQNAVTAGSFVKTGGTSSEYLMADGSVSSGPSGGGGDGEFVHIGEAPPADPQEGQQWMEVPADGDATMWIYDGGKWLQQPGGKDGADGADGISNVADATKDGVIATWDNTDGRWTPNDNVTASSAGTVTSKGPLRSNTECSTRSDQERIFDGRTTAASSYLSFGDANSGNPTSQRIGSKGDDLFLATAGVDRLTIGAEGNATFSGKVGIGSPVTNEDLLHVEGSGEVKSRIATTSADGMACLYLNAGTKNWGIRNEASTRNFVIRDLSAAEDRLTIDASGDATFSNRVSSNEFQGRNWFRESTDTGLAFGNNSVFPIDSDKNSKPKTVDLGAVGNEFKSGYFSNQVITRSGVAINARDLIETLSTLRNATKDETVDVRQALASACDKLIEKFEAMQSTATQEIES